MDISVWIPKGGCAKTLTSLSLAGYLASLGRRVLVVDLDPGSGALMWAKKAADQGLETPFTVAAAKSWGFEDVIYDHAPVPPEGGLPGRMVVMPLLLDAITYPYYRRGVSMLDSLGIPHLAIPSRVRLDRAEQKRLLKKAYPGVPYLKDRAILPKAYGQGLTVFDDRFLPQTVLALQKSGKPDLRKRKTAEENARDEAQAMATYVIEQFQSLTNARIAA